MRDFYRTTGQPSLEKCYEVLLEKVLLLVFASNGWMLWLGTPAKEGDRPGPFLCHFGFFPSKLQNVEINA